MVKRNPYRETLVSVCPSVCPGQLLFLLKSGKSFKIPGCYGVQPGYMGLYPLKPLICFGAWRRPRAFLRHTVTVTALFPVKFPTTYTRCNIMIRWEKNPTSHTQCYTVQQFTDLFTSTKIMMIYKLHVNLSSNT